MRAAFAENSREPAFAEMRKRHCKIDLARRIGCDPQDLDAVFAERIRHRLQRGFACHDECWIIRRRRGELRARIER